MQIPVNAPQGETTSIYMDDGSSLARAGIRTESLPESDQYALQGEAFSRAIHGKVSLPYGVEDAVQSMRVIDASFRKEKCKMGGKKCLSCKARKHRFCSYNEWNLGSLGDAAV